MKRVLCGIPLLLFALLMYANSFVIPANGMGGPLVIIERSDFSKYENGKYVGHVYREARLDVAITKVAKGLQFKGEVMILEEAYRDMMPIAKRMNTILPIQYIQKADGSFEITKDAGYPLLRNIPIVPAQQLVIGNTWEGSGTVVIRGNPDELYVRVPVLVAYEFAGVTKYSNENVFYIKAQYAIRYKGTDKLGEPTMIHTDGGRTADIYISMQTGSPLFIREVIDETYYYQNGKTVRFKGFLLHFIRGAFSSETVLLALGRTGTVSESTQNQSSGSETVQTPAQNMSSSDTTISSANNNDQSGAPASTENSPDTNVNKIVKSDAFEVVNSQKGQVLLLFDLRFLPDSAELLPSEKPRLDEIAKILLSIPDRMILVEGHTADIGNQQGQYALSEARAKAIVDELVKRGVPAGRFIYKGWGADKPIAPNDTEQNRSRNRRVEITILH